MLLAPPVPQVPQGPLALRARLGRPGPAGRLGRLGRPGPPAAPASPASGPVTVTTTAGGASAQVGVLPLSGAVLTEIAASGGLPAERFAQQLVPRAMNFDGIRFAVRLRSTVALGPTLVLVTATLYRGTDSDPTPSRRRLATLAGIQRGWCNPRQLQRGIVQRRARPFRRARQRLHPDQFDRDRESRGHHAPVAGDRRSQHGLKPTTDRWARTCPERAYLWAYLKGRNGRLAGVSETRRAHLNPL